MTRKRETLKNTTNSSVYKKLQWKHVRDVPCMICLQRTGSIYGGCGWWYLPKREKKNWKNYRKTQYRVVKK